MLISLPFAGEAANGPVVLLVKRASGDEEITATGIDVRGVLLCQSLPHLSHLGELLNQSQALCVLEGVGLGAFMLGCMVHRPAWLEGFRSKLSTAKLHVMWHRGSGRGAVSRPAASQPPR